MPPLPPRHHGTAGLLLLVAGLATWLLLGLQPLTASGLEEPLAIGEQTPYQSLLPHTSMAVSEIPGLSPDVVLAGEDLVFSPVTDSRINLGYHKGDVWFRFALQNTTTRHQRLFLESGFSRLDAVELFTITPTGILRQSGGDTLPYTERPVASRLLVFPLDLPPAQTRTFLIRVHSTSSLHIPLAISSAVPLLEKYETRSTLDGIYYGVSVIIMIYALIAALAIREPLFWFYLGHVAAMTGGMMSLDGFGIPLWSQFVTWQEYSVVVFQLLNALMIIPFARLFLKLPEAFPRLDVLNKVFFGYFLALLPIIWFLPYWLASMLTVAAESLLIVSIFLQALYLSLQPGAINARVFAFAWSLFFSVAIFVTYANLGLTHNYLDSIYYLKLAFLLEMVIITLGLAYRLYQLREDQLENRRLAIEARAESEAKSQFMAKMSHEIRTPMNGVLGITELLAHTRLDPVQQDYVDTIQQSGHALLAIINDILDFSRLGSQSFKLEAIPFSLREMVTRLKKLFEAEQQTRQINLITTLDIHLPERVVGDPHRIRQVLVNLLSNAFKFTDQGEVRLSITLKEKITDADGEEQVRIHFEVTDTGIGIARQKLPQLFQAFTQADDSTTRKYGGSGLGLSICRQLVELMGGTIQAESTPGEGSRFWFELTLPVAQNTSSISSATNPVIQPQLKTEPSLENLVVLVVEDNPINWKVVSSLLEKLQVKPVWASNGAQALEMLDMGLNPDLIFMDCEMPHMDGFETTRAIREKERQGFLFTSSDHIPIVALSAHVTPRHVNLCEESGMDGHVAKPVTRAMLFEALQRYIPQRAGNDKMPAA